MDWKNATTTIGALAAGAAAMYLMDPAQGRRRRALARDKAVHAGHVVGDTTGVVARDLSNRLRGAVAEQRSRMRQRDDSEEKVEARARAILGRVVSHPHAISIDRQDGTLVVSGYILDREVTPLLEALRSVPGIREVENRLEVGRNPSEMPSLQGGRPRSGLVPDLFQRQMAPATRVMLGGASASLAGYGISRRDWAGGIVAAVGLLLGARAATNLPLRRLVGFGMPGTIRVQNAIEVEAPVEEVFDFFCRFENFPRFMQHIRHVSQTETGAWHWEADGPLGIGVSWDAVVTRMQPNRRITWRSLPGSAIGNAGGAWFEAVGPDRTRVHIQMVYSPPAGAVGHAVATLFGKDPVHQMDEDLVRFKSIIERGKTGAHGRHVSREEVAA